MPLPGSRTYRPPAWRLSIGKKTEKGYPEKSDHFRTMELDQNTKRYVLNEDMQALLRESTGLEKPDVMPFIPADDDPGSVAFSELAVFQAGRSVCSCSNFVEKPQDVCAQQELAWPPPYDDQGNAPSQYYHGIAQRRYYRRGSEGPVALRNEESVECDPATCPFAKSADREHNSAFKDLLGKYPAKTVFDQGVKLCKPHIVASFVLPWVDNQCPYAKFTSAAWGTGRALLQSLTDIKSSAGMLAGLPLQLRIVWVQMQTSRGAQFNPVVIAEPRVNWQQLPAAGQELLAVRHENTQLRHQQQQVERVLTAERKALPEGRAFQDEFHPGTDSSDAALPNIDERCEDLAQQAGWSQGKYASRANACQADHDWAELERELAEELSKREDAEVFDGEVEAARVTPPMDEVRDQVAAERDADAEATADDNGQGAMAYGEGT